MSSWLPLYRTAMPDLVNRPINRQYLQAETSHVQRQSSGGPAHPGHRRRHRTWQVDGGALPRVGRRSPYLRTPQDRLRRNRDRADGPSWRPASRAMASTSEIALAVDEMVETIFRGGRADRPHQQRRRQFHLAHRRAEPARLRCGRQHRHARHLLRDPCGRPALDRGKAARQRGVDHRDLGAQRLALCGAVGDEQVRDPRHDHVARQPNGAITASGSTPSRPAKSRPKA